MKSQLSDSFMATLHQDPPDRGAYAVPDFDGPVAGLRDALAHTHLGRETRVGKVQPQPRLPRRLHAGGYGVITVEITR